MAEPPAIENCLNRPGPKQVVLKESTVDDRQNGYLGRDDEEHICFMSASGCKSRWRENGERRFRFLFGRSWLWRGELIPEAQTVYLCEGETDVVSLIDRRIEDDGETVAVGVQGATLNIQPWAFLFTDKHVVIAMDDGEAGRKAAEKIERVLAIGESYCYRDMALILLIQRKRSSASYWIPTSSSYVMD